MRNCWGGFLNGFVLGSNVCFRCFLPSNNIRLDKTHQFCGKKFVAKTTVTQFCSDPCAKKAYKVRIRDQKVQDSIKKEREAPTYNPVLAIKESLSIQKTAQLLEASRWTIYRLISERGIKAQKIRNRTIIKRSDIDNLFNGHSTDMIPASTR
jgi:excisionase family DNA binding protein